MPLYDSADHERFSEKIDLPAHQLGMRLENYLRHQKLLARIVPDKSHKQTYFEDGWVRDISLRYYYLHWDERGRHKVVWKMVWRVRELNKKSSELSAELFEILFWGPQEDMPATAESESGNWVQTPPDGYRLAREFTKFLGTILPAGSPALRRYETFRIIPDLQFKPRGDRLRKVKDPVIFSGPYFF